MYGLRRGRRARGETSRRTDTGGSVGVAGVSGGIGSNANSQGGNNVSDDTRGMLKEMLRQKEMKLVVVVLVVQALVQTLGMIAMLVLAIMVIDKAILILLKRMFKG